MATAVIFRGKATIEGTVGTFAAIIGTGVSNLNSSFKLTQNWSEEVITDNHGYDIVWLYRNEHAMVDVELYWMADTAAHAALPITADGTNATVSALGQPVFAPGSWCTLSGFTLAGFNGDYQIQSGWEVSQTPGGIAKYTCKFKKYASADQVAAMKVIPT